MEEGEFKNDREHGDWNFYFEDGSLMEKKTFLNGTEIKKGEVNTYYESGELFYTENYVDGLKQGESKIYHKTGELDLYRKLC